MSGTVYWSYPILPFGIVACTFLPTTFLEIAVYILRLTHPQHIAVSGGTKKRIHPSCSRSVFSYILRRSQRSFKGGVNVARHPKDEKRLRGRLVFSGLEMKSAMRLTRMSSFSCFLSLFVTKTIRILYLLSVQNFFGRNEAVLKINMMIGWMIVRWLSDWTPPATQAVGQH